MDSSRDIDEVTLSHYKCRSHLTKLYPANNSLMRLQEHHTLGKPKQTTRCGTKVSDTGRILRNKLAVSVLHLVCSPHLSFASPEMGPPLDFSG
jgi:hypothetical protein